MAFKVLAVLALVAVASAQYHHHGHHEHATEHHDYDHHNYDHHEEAPAKYDFSYSVHDTHTGDIKHQYEVRDADKVHGSYSLVDADGLKRVVDYTADDHHGFQATVRREPIVHHHVPEHHEAPVHHDYRY